LPELGRSFWPPGFLSGDLGIVYEVLVASAGFALAAGLARSVDHETDTVIELTNGAPGEVLVELQAQLRWNTDPVVHRALVIAVELLQANQELQGELERRGDAVRASRERLLNAAVDQRRSIEGILASGAVRHLDELSTLLARLRAASGDDDAVRTLTTDTDGGLSGLADRPAVVGGRLAILARDQLWGVLHEHKGGKYTLAAPPTPATPTS
jgi:hypothetical protein